MPVKNRWSNFRGLTLIEILIAMTMTLIVLGAMMYAFRYASQEITKGRAMMELSNQLLVVQDLLRSDLDGVTVDVRPWSKTASPNGYFEYIEGFGSDKSRLDATGGVIPGVPDGVVDAVRPDGVMGDIDDVLALTVRSRNRPFRGRWFDGASTQMIESNVAEVIWWTTFVDTNANGIADYNETVTLHRRLLLVRPDLIATLNGPAPLPNALGLTPGVGEELQKFFLQNDISARPADLDGDGVLETMIPNSLADLSKRENRFAHSWIDPAVGNTFPHQLQLGLLTQFSITAANIQNVDAVVVPTLTAEEPDISTHIGDDVIISDIAAFDLQVFSPDTPVLADGGLIFEPDDVHDINAPAANQVETGAFVDLAYNRVAFGTAGQPAFATFPTLASSLNYVDALTGYTYFVFDTYSTHYESDGIDQDGDAFIDEGTNGVDDDGANGVDDNDERETLPPYPNRALGFKATVRVVERDTKQVRQTEIISSFVPQ